MCMFLFYFIVRAFYIFSSCYFGEWNKSRQNCTVCSNSSSHSHSHETSIPRRCWNPSQNHSRIHSLSHTHTNTLTQTHIFHIKPGRININCFRYDNRLPFHCPCRTTMAIRIIFNSVNNHSAVCVFFFSSVCSLVPTYLFTILITIITDRMCSNIRQQRRMEKNREFCRKTKRRVGKKKGIKVMTKKKQRWNNNNKS